MTIHTDREYEKEIKTLRDSLLLMAGRVEAMIADAVRSLVDGDVELAEKTILADHRVNKAEVDIDDLCLLILVKRHPMARDLRFVALGFKMVTDLERMGDMAVNICERAIDLAGVPQMKMHEDIPRMAAVVQRMLRDVMDAFVDGDADRAEQIMHVDDEVDELYHDIFRSLLAAMIHNPSVIESCTHLQSVAKYIERIGDHATNLAEYIVYMQRAKDVRHRGKLTVDSDDK